MGLSEEDLLAESFYSAAATFMLRRVLKFLNLRSGSSSLLPVLFSLGELGVLPPPPFWETTEDLLLS